MRILIVDNHPLFREALGNLLNSIYLNASIFEVGSFIEASDFIEQYQNFDLVFFDIILLNQSDICGLTNLQQRLGKTPIIIVSAQQDAALVQQSIEHGVRAYITKSATGNEIKSALHLISNGEIYISPIFLRKNVSVMPGSENLIKLREVLRSLTPRQREVWQLMSQGLSNKAIAQRLTCADGTVKLHVSAILRALNVHNRTEAVHLLLSHTLP